MHPLNSWLAARDRKTNSSAIKPILLLCGICVPTGLATAKLAVGVISYAGLGVAVVPLLFALWQISYFTINDRDRLHDERHLEAKMAIGLLGEGKSLKQIESSPLGGNPEFLAGGEDR